MASLQVPSATDGAAWAVDLASDAAHPRADPTWSISVDGNASRQIAVPGGGFNSDLQVWLHLYDQLLCIYRINF
jgi:hypothetical protein